MKSNNILFLSANPKNTSRLRLDEEMREIKNGLKLSNYRDSIIVNQVEAVTVNDLRRALLDYRPSIVHFSGHGLESGIAIENPSGRAHYLSNSSIGNFFELFTNTVSLVVLNSCYSEEQAKFISEHIGYVIGMKKEIGDKASIAFSTGFYDAISAGENIEDSFRFGVNAIELLNIPEYLTPKLLVNNSKVNPNQARIVDTELIDLTNDEESHDNCAIAVQRLINESISKIENQNVENRVKARTIFRRLYRGESFSTLDQIIIDKIRTDSSVYNTDDRRLIISGLVLSCLVKFSNDKLEKLIDFVIDKYDDIVWREALTGIQIILITRRRHLDKKLVILLQRIHSDPEFQEFIGSTITSIYNRTYDSVYHYQNITAETRKDVVAELNYYNSIIDLSGNIESEFEIANLIINNDPDGLIKLVKTTGYNLLKIDFKRESILRHPEMWFYPFSISAINSLYGASYQAIDYDVEGFLNGLEASPFLDIEKYFLASNFDKLSNTSRDFIKSMINYDLIDCLSETSIINRISPDDLIVRGILMKYHVFLKHYQYHNSIKSPFSDILENDQIHKNTLIKILISPNQMMIREAERLNSIGKNYKAATIYEKVFQSSPTISLLSKVIYSYYKCQKYNKCISIYENLNYNYSDRSVNLNMANVYIQLENYLEAEKMLKINIECDKKDFESLYTLGVCYYSNNKLEKAMKCFEKELDIKPSNTTRFFLIKIYMKFKYYDDALFEISMLNSSEAKENEFIIKEKNRLILEIYKLKGDIPFR